MQFWRRNGGLRSRRVCARQLCPHGRDALHRSSRPRTTHISHRHGRVHRARTTSCIGTNDWIRFAGRAAGAPCRNGGLLDPTQSWRASTIGSAGPSSAWRSCQRPIHHQLRARRERRTDPSTDGELAERQPENRKATVAGLFRRNASWRQPPDSGSRGGRLPDLARPESAVSTAPGGTGYAAPACP